MNVWLGNWREHCLSYVLLMVSLDFLLVVMHFLIYIILFHQQSKTQKAMQTAQMSIVGLKSVAKQAICVKKMNEMFDILQAR